MGVWAELLIFRINLAGMSCRPQGGHLCLRDTLSPCRHRGLIAVPHSRNEVTRDLRDLLSNGGGHKKRPSAQDRPLKICFTKRFAAIEDKAKPSSHLLHQLGHQTCLTHASAARQHHKSGVILKCLTLHVLQLIHLLLPIVELLHTFILLPP